MNIELTRVQQAPPPKAFCFRHPDRPAVRVIAGDGFCDFCLHEDSAGWTGNRKGNKVIPLPHIVGRWHGGTGGPVGKPRGHKIHRPKSWKPLTTVTRLRDLTLALAKARRWSRPVLVEYDGRVPHQLRVNAHSYAYRFLMRWATKERPEGLYVWRIA
jgi:hypothetical protein